MLTHWRYLMRRSIVSVVAGLVIGASAMLLIGAQSTRPSGPKYQVMPWGPNTILVVDNDTNEASVLFQEYNEKAQYAAPWRCGGKFNVDEAVNTKSTRYSPGMIVPQH